ncbi:MAG: hypothetical protein GY788_09670 [bacterium]|nr:hypothetical protein [bacterium]
MSSTWGGQRTHFGEFAISVQLDLLPRVPQANSGAAQDTIAVRSPICSKASVSGLQRFFTWDSAGVWALAMGQAVGHREETDRACHWGSPSSVWPLISRHV